MGWKNNLFITVGAVTPPFLAQNRSGGCVLILLYIRTPLFWHEIELVSGLIRINPAQSPFFFTSGTISGAIPLEIHLQVRFCGINCGGVRGRRSDEARGRNERRISLELMAN